MSKLNDNRSIDNDRKSSNILIISKSRVSSAKNKGNFITLQDGEQKYTQKMKNGPLTKSGISQTILSMKKELAKNSKSYVKLDDYRISNYFLKKNILKSPKREKEENKKDIKDNKIIQNKYKSILSVETTRSNNMVKSIEKNKDNKENNSNNENIENHLIIKNNEINNNQEKKNCKIFNENNIIENNEVKINNNENIDIKKENNDNNDINLIINLKNKNISQNYFNNISDYNINKKILNNKYNSEEINQESSRRLNESITKKDNINEKINEASDETVGDKHSKLVLGSLMAHIGGLNTENDNANINNILTSNGIDEDKSNRNSINSKNDLISESKSSKIIDNEDGDEHEDDYDEKIKNDNNRNLISNYNINNNNNMINIYNSQNDNKKSEEFEKIKNEFTNEETEKKKLIKSLYVKTNNNSNIYRMCGICEHTYYLSKMFSPECNIHFFCKRCTKNYYEDIIEEGKKEILCPFFNCREVVDINNLKKIISQEHFKRLYRKKINNKNNLEENKNTSGSLYFTKIKTNIDKKNIKKYTQKNVIDINSNKIFYNYNSGKDVYCPFCYEESLFTKTSTHYYKCLNCLNKICRYCFKEFNDRHIDINNNDHCKVYYRLDEKNDKNNNIFISYLIQLFFVLACFYLCFAGTFLNIRKIIFYIFKVNKNKNILKYILGYFFTIIFFIITMPFIFLLYPYFPSIMSAFDY